MRMRFWGFLGALLLCSGAAHAEDWLRFEFIGVRAFDGSTTLGSKVSPPFVWGIQGTAPTLILDPWHLYWTTLRVDYSHVNRAWPHGGKAKPGDFYGFSSTLGTTFSFGEAKRHELRVGLGMGYLLQIGGTYYDDPDLVGTGGFSLSPEIVYLYHFCRYFALQAGLEGTFMATFDHDKSQHFSRTHLFGAFAGFAI